MTDHGRASGPLLAVEDVSVTFGAVQALTRVSLDIRRGETVAIIGPNGAGKTTLLNVISGFYHASSGRILYEGRDRTHLRPYDVAALGIARTFQINRLFRHLSVLENVYIAVAERVGAAPSMLRPAWRRGDVVEQQLEQRLEVAAFRVRVQ